jgi:hypothetical protein
MRPAWFLLALIACGDNRFVFLDAPPAEDAPPVPDAPPDMATDPLPDLSLVGALMMDTDIVMQAFDGDSCEMVEQCIGAPGLRRLLKFDTVTQNLGTADLVVGVPPAIGTSSPPFEWSRCHGHHHFSGYANYDLLDGNGVVVSGHKQAFCILDTIRVQAGAPTNGYSCQNQGMSVGWADVYARDLPCQWIDITGVPSGTYTLRVQINPEQKLVESDYSNNELTISVTL